jgi:hypothetical protein
VTTSLLELLIAAKNRRIFFTITELKRPRLFLRTNLGVLGSSGKNSEPSEKLDESKEH